MVLREVVPTPEQEKRDHAIQNRPESHPDADVEENITEQAAKRGLSEEDTVQQLAGEAHAREIKAELEDAGAEVDVEAVIALEKELIEAEKLVDKEKENMKSRKWYLRFTNSQAYINAVTEAGLIQGQILDAKQGKKSEVQDAAPKEELEKDEEGSSRDRVGEGRARREKRSGTGGFGRN